MEVTSCLFLRDPIRIAMGCIECWEQTLRKPLSKQPPLELCTCVWTETLRIAPRAELGANEEVRNAKLMSAKYFKLSSSGGVVAGNIHYLI